MAKNRNNLKERIRRGAGNPRSEIVTDADIDYFIDEAIDEISRHAPAWVFSYIETVAGQASYTLLDSDIHDVCYCYYVPSFYLLDEEFEDIALSSDLALSSISFDVELTKYLQFVAALRIKGIMDYYDWEYNAFEKKLYLINPPDTTGDKVYFVGLKKWTFTTIPDRFERYVQMFGIYRTLEQYARTQRRETSVSHAGDLTPWSEASTILSDARRTKSEFDEYMLVEGKKMAVFLGD